MPVGDLPTCITLSISEGQNILTVIWQKYSHKHKFNLLAMRWWNTWWLTTTCFSLQVSHHQVVLLLEIK